MISHSFPFDPTCGYTLDQLRTIGPPPTEPADFAAFWQETYKEVLALRSAIDVRRLWSPEPDTEVFEVFFGSLGGARIGAYVSRPRESRGGVVVGHGYGNPGGPVLRPGMTVIMPCIRGFTLSAAAAYPWRPPQHVVCGLEHRDTYILRGAVADLWRAASVLLELYPDTASNLVYTGGSFGGGLGALAVPWDRRWRAAYLDVPTFGHHPLRLQFASNGSGESVRHYCAAHPEAVTVLAYYDAATAATYIDVPVVCTPACFDPTVVPPGQFAVNNAIPAHRRQTLVLRAGHWTDPEDAPVRQAAAAAVDALFLGKAPVAG